MNPLTAAQPQVWTTNMLCNLPETLSMSRDKVAVSQAQVEKQLSLRKRNDKSKYTADVIDGLTD